MVLLHEDIIVLSELICWYDLYKQNKIEKIVYS